MNEITYTIVEHDGGWAYKVGNTFSETFARREAAEAAANTAAAEQRVPGDDEMISWEDEAGRWHDEAERGTDRPTAYVARDARQAATAPNRREPRHPDRRGGQPLLDRNPTAVSPLLLLLLVGAVGYLLAALTGRTSRR